MAEDMNKSAAETEEEYQPVKTMVRHPSSAAAEKNFFKCIRKNPPGNSTFIICFRE